ncbi:MAG: FtsW/RodA/SpoVE family cell cycle protein, partial [Anaerolineae bacterium]|nr:FtsW/RodA/SpoVE family cell cycle protein [Thermoflexales bacterium]MDW8408670.1 FtsW/RodA/SpoVE family cell cycle protein [Anaerolineae bacterium]
AIGKALSRLVRLEHVRAVAPSIFMWLIAIALLTTQQDLGAAALLLITFVSMLYLASGRPALPLLGLAGLLIGGTASYMMSARVAQRIDIWLNPWLDPQNRSFQIVQSLIAVASGSVFGAGIGSGQPGYVPAVHTDFPFAAIGEEMGLAGMIGLIAAFGVLVLRGWRIARRAKTSYGMLLAGGLSASFTAQVCVIIGGNLGLLPLTGVTLPFISYGGSSLLVSFISVGLLLRLSADGEMSTKGEDRLRPRAPEAFLPSPAQHAASRRAMRLSAALFAVISLAAGYWAVLRSAELVARSDNPRLIDAERAIRRGPILAHDGTTLAYSVPAQQGDQLTHLTPYTRRYPHPEVGPVVGYSSWRHGAGGLERHADAILRGSLSSLERLLHRPQFGAAFTTTLDLALQSQLHRALTGYVGGAIVLEARTGEVLALSSAPSFDPNRLDEEWDALRADARAPLLNRVTQALYQPGRLLQWLYEAESGRPRGQAWDASDRFRLGQPVPFELENAYTPYPSTVTYSETIGQGQLRITPLRVAVAVAELLAGRLVTPTLSKRISESSAVNLPAAGAKIDLRQPLVFFAQNGPRQFVGWLIMAIDGRVVVIGLEQSDTSATRLRAIAAQMRAALE